MARLARAKAAAIAVAHPQAWVIGSDQVAVRSDAGGAARILGKPGTAERLIAQLQESSGRTLTFLTAVALVRQESGALHEFMDTTLVRFRTLDAATIRRYVELRIAARLRRRIQERRTGHRAVRAIESQDPTALIGLPLIRLAAVLRERGLQIP